MIYFSRHSCLSLLAILFLTLEFTFVSPKNLQKEVDKFCHRFATPQKCDNGITLPKTVVSFLTIYNKTNVQLGNHEPIKFDKVIENIGDGYNPSTGKFTAPVNGIYSISLTIMSEKNNYLHLGIMKNGQPLTNVFSDNQGLYPQASNTVNLSLKKGDTVWLQRIRGRIIHVNPIWPYNIFSGVLIART